MKKIEVPKGMLEAADEAISKTRSEEAQRRGIKNVELWPDNIKRISIEAALRWLSENPIVPTTEQAGECWTEALNGQGDAVQVSIELWVKRMFDAPEPAPRSDLISIANKLTANPDWRSCDLYRALLESFRLGEALAKKQDSAQ